MILFLLAAAVSGAVAAALFGFFFMRSSKNMPKEWRQWKTEILWQINGFTSLFEDHLLRRTNVVGKLYFYFYSFCRIIDVY